MENITILIFTDGSCWPNPNGDMGLGVVCYEAVNFSIENSNSREIKSSYDSIKEIHTIQKKIKFGTQHYSKTSNNMAEHCALQEAFVFIHTKQNTKFIVFSDSEIMVKQMRKEYGINPKLAYAYPALQNTKMLKEETELGKEIEFVWIPREFNQKADYLSKL